MHKLLITPVDNRIKNVYSLRKETGIKSEQLHTGSLFIHQFTYSPVHNPQLIPLLVQVFTPQFSTSKFILLTDTNRQLYPQSTAPINKKKKGKMERNT